MLHANNPLLQNSTTMKYASLHQHKRSNDETNARRLSVHDQYAAPGFLGGLWHNFTKGKPSK